MKFYFPHNNLGCLGLRIGTWYIDISRTGIFATNGTDRWSLNLSGLHKWH